MGKGSSFLDNIVRSYVKFSSFIYYSVKDICPPGYINTAGKVLGNGELSKMIDASLDMRLTNDRFIQEFEQKLGNYLNIKHVLTVNSGSAANLIAISVLTSSKLETKKLKPDDEIILIATTTPTILNSILQNRLIPVFVDIDENTYNIDIEQLRETITEKTKAIFVSHTLGNPCNIEEIAELCAENNIWLIEDNSTALGAQYNGKYTGTFGHISILNFDSSSQITTGEGGAILTNDPELYNIANSYINGGKECYCTTEKDHICNERFSQKQGTLPQGFDHKHIYSNFGYNCKMTEWQAAIGIAQLKKLPSFIKTRKRNFDLLYNGLKDLEEHLQLPLSNENSEPSWFGFLITVKKDEKFDKNGLVKFLEEHKIGTSPLSDGNILRQPVFIENNIKIKIKNSLILFSSRLYEKYYNMLPNTDMTTNNSFWTGVWPGITEKEIKYVIGIIRSYFGK